MAASYPKLMLVASAVLVASLWLFPGLSASSPVISPLGNLQGIPFPSLDGETLITEKVAHADIYLNRSVFGQQLDLSLTFIPHDVKRLSVGLRQSGFWLSYDPIIIYTGAGQSVEEPVTRSVRINLTDKFQETDRSLDVMFFADYDPPSPDFALKTADQTYWQLSSLSAAVSPGSPNLRSIIDFVISLARRERAS